MISVTPPVWYCAFWSAWLVALVAIGMVLIATFWTIGYFVIRFAVAAGK